MPHIFQTINKKTGEPHPLYRFVIYDYRGRRVKRTGATTFKETKRIAEQMQAHQYAIRNGVAKAPRMSDKPHDIGQLIEEYLGWGRTQGGRRGRPWGAEHARKRTQNLAFWREKLNLATQFDLLECQIRVERIIRRLLDGGSSGKTVWNRVDALAAFGRWCVERGYLEDDPLRRLRRINTDPVGQRRPLSPEEFQLLLQHCLPERVLQYETAVCSGLRANELRHITPRHIDVFRCGIKLEASWTKNRQEGLQPLPRWLVDKLVEAARGMHPDTPFFSVQRTHAARMLRDDLARAGIPVDKPGEGRVVFHSLRMTYCTQLDEVGASAKTTQDLARHSTPTLTMQRYVRVREERSREAVEKIGVLFRTPASQQNPNDEMAQTAESGKK